MINSSMTVALATIHCVLYSTAMKQPNSLFICSNVTPLEHQGLLDNMQWANHRLGREASVRWRDLGKAGIMVLQSGEYHRLTEETGSRLRGKPVADVARTLQEDVLSDYDKGQIKLEETAFRPNRTGDYAHIGYVTEDPQLEEAREAVQRALDYLNGTPGEWRFPFDPFISIATVPRTLQTDTVLEVFDTIRPNTIAVQAPKAFVR